MKSFQHGLLALVSAVGLSVLSGCGMGVVPPVIGGSAGTPNTTPTGTHLYTINISNVNSSYVSQVAGYSVGANSVTASTTLMPSASDYFINLASDASGNLYTVDESSATNPTSYSVKTFSVDASGTTTALRSFSSPYLTTTPMGLVVDKDGAVYTVSANQTLQFPGGQSGVLVPTVVLPVGNIEGVIATDSQSNLYVVSHLTSGDAHGEIEIFSHGYNDVSSPVRTIVPASPIYINAIAVDGAGNVYVAGKDNSNVEQIQVYAATASGNSTPTRVIAGADTVLHYPADVAVDDAGLIYVRDAATTDNASTQVVNVYAASATGDAAPQKTYELSGFNGDGHDLVLLQQ